MAGLFFSGKPRSPDFAIRHYSTHTNHANMIHDVVLRRMEQDKRRQREGRLLLLNTMENHQLILQDSGNFEYYTPKPIIEAARRVMGGIDLDPASSKVANRTIKARRFFSLDDPDEWRGPWAASSPGVRVWMNHPFNRSWNADWIAKLLEEYEAGRVSQACCITWASTSETWFRPLYAGTMCLLTPRTGYILPNGEKKRGATKGSVVTYLGDNTAAFVREFSSLGKIPNIHLACFV